MVKQKEVSNYSVLIYFPIHSFCSHEDYTTNLHFEFRGLCRWSWSIPGLEQTAQWWNPLFESIFQFWNPGCTRQNTCRQLDWM